MMLNKTFNLLLLSLIPLLGFSQAKNSQYPDSGNKIRLGFQTTGDGLIWRDTQPKVAGYEPINNKASWIVLDTVNNKFYHYKRSNNTWNLAVGQDIDTANFIATKYNLGLKLSISDTQNMLTPYWRSGRFSGVLPVANGGTGQTTATAALNALLPVQSQSTTIGATLKSNGTNTYWDNFSAAGTVQDQSGNFYNTVAIGTQVWFKENLRTKKYRNGNNIIVKTNTDTSTLVGQMYYYGNDSLTNYPVYGALYNWMATQVSDSLCPTGWHVPTDAEWTTLTTYLLGEGVAGGKMKSIGTTYWNSPNTGATNETGFSVLPGGGRGSDGIFSSIRSNAFFWSATEYEVTHAYFRALFNANGFGLSLTANKSDGLSVRCLKN